MKLNESVAVITGGASGLGAAAARMIHGGGGSVAVIDLPTSAGDELVREFGERAVFLPADITRPTEVAAAVDAAADAFGALTVLVSSAGISSGMRLIGRSGEVHPLDHFRRHVEVNLIGLFDVVRNVAALMTKNEPNADGERGVIVNIASIAGLEGQAGQEAYAASKGGVIALTLPLARDLASFGIRVVSISPGLIDTPMFSAIDDQVRDHLHDLSIFPRRLGSPDEVAALVRHVIESPFLNGENVRLDGGIRLGPR
jgi:3-hydroxyacyl-CoA dehydrogenase/3-hydroxy-2-methylbutyryl-CoA dehydrogenase